MAEAPTVLTGILAIIGAAAGLYYMYRCYRIPARPYWNHWQTGASFLGNALVLGGLLIGLLNVPYLISSGGEYSRLLSTLAPVLVAGLIIESIGLYFHARDLTGVEHEGAVSHYIQTTTFGKSYLLRNVLLGLNAVLIVALALAAVEGWLTLSLWMVAAAGLLLTSLIGRALFSVLVVPTTMPGAFFWKNKGFEDHAREIGLAANPAVGVVMHFH